MSPLSCTSVPVSRDVSDPARGRVLHRQTGLPPAQAGIFPGASSRPASTNVDNLRSTEDGSGSKGVFAGDRRSQAGSASGRPARGGQSGRPATEIIRKSSFQESSRLWRTSQGPPGKLRAQTYVGYFGNLQLAPEPENGGDKPDEEGEKRSVLAPGSQAAPAGPPTDTDHVVSRSSKLLRGRSYLFQDSQNPAGTGKPVGSVGISRVQQGGPAEPQTAAHPLTPVSWSTHVPKPAQTPKRLHGFRGFERPSQNRPEEKSGQLGWFRMSKVNRPLLAKYSFSLRDADKREDSASATARWLAPGSKEMPERIKAGNPDQRSFSTHRIPRLFPKPLSHRSDQPGKEQPGFQGFSQRNSQIWQPGRSQMHRWDSRSGEGRGEGTATAELKKEDLKMQPKTSGSAKAKAGIPTEVYRENGEIFISLRTRLNQTQQEFTESSQAATPATSSIPPADLGTKGGQTEPGPLPGPVPGPLPGPEPGPPSKSHQSKLRGETKVMVSRPRESFTYTDVLGKASFSSIDANARSYDPASRKVR